MLPESSKSKTGLKTKKEKSKKDKTKKDKSKNNKTKKEESKKDKTKKEEPKKGKQTTDDRHQPGPKLLRCKPHMSYLSKQSLLSSQCDTHTHMHIIVALVSCQGDFLRFQHYSTAAMEIKPWICCGTLICSPMVAMNTCSFMPHNQATTLVHWLRLRQAFIALPCAGASDGEDQVDKMKRLKHNIISVH